MASFVTALYKANPLVLPIRFSVAVVDLSMDGLTLPDWGFGIAKVAVREAGGEEVR